MRELDRAALHKSLAPVTCKSCSSAKRTFERLKPIFSVVRFADCGVFASPNPAPMYRGLGYFHSVRFADESQVPVFVQGKIEQETSRRKREHYPTDHLLN